MFIDELLWNNLKNVIKKERKTVAVLIKREEAKKLVELRDGQGSMTGSPMLGERARNFFKDDAIGAHATKPYIAKIKKAATAICSAADDTRAQRVRVNHRQQHPIFSLSFTSLFLLFHARI